MKNRLCIFRNKLLLGLLLVFGALEYAIAVVPDVCMRSTGGLAGIPILDGTVTGDAGWNGAVQLNLSGDMGGTTASKMLLGRANVGGQDSLIIGLVVDAPNPSPDTTVVLGFIPDDSAFASDWRLHIKPFATGGAQATYWHNSTTHLNWNAVSAVGTPATVSEWPRANLHCDPACPLSSTATLPGNHWELELVIPIAAAPAGIRLGAGSNPNYFNMYVNVMNTTLGGSPSTGQDVWPPLSTLVPGTITQNTPDPGTADKWGKVWLQNAPTNACTGVKLDWNNVGVQDPNNPSNIVYEIQRVHNASISETTIAQCDALPDNANLGVTGDQNVFIAKPENTMPGQARVSVTFRMADWGIPGIDLNAATGGTPHGQQALGLFKPLGAPVPVGCNPTVSGGTQCAGVPAVGTIGGNPTAEEPIDSTLFGVYRANWALNYKQSCFYKFTATPTNQGTAHQCMQVDMDSTNPNTRFLNRSVQINMDFANASAVKRLASISGDQGPLPRGKSKHRFLLQVDQDEQGSPYGSTNDSVGIIAGRDGKTRGNKSYRSFRDKHLNAVAANHFSQDVDHMMSWIVRGFVYTGDKIIIDGNAYEYRKRAGDFGLVAGHKGPITGWTADFRSTSTTDGTPMSLVAPGSNVYILEVEPGHKATAEVTLVAEEAGVLPVAIWLALGPTIPHDNFSNSYDGGMTGTLGLEYMITPTYSVEATYSSHRFSGKNGVSDIDVTQTGVNAKMYFTSQPLRWFATAGVGSYSFNPGSSNNGVTVGAGLQYQLSQKLSLEGRYILHTVNSNPSNTTFSTPQLDIRYAF